jgi:NADH-quinone oxidoreductase subunit J
LFNDAVQIFLIIATVVLAFLAIEIRDLLHSVISLCGMCISLGILFGILNAPYVIVFQLLIYAGATIVLFIAVVMLTTREGKE